MKKNLLLGLLFSTIVVSFSCEPEGSGGGDPNLQQEDIISIPDAEFKNVLIHTNSIDTNGDHIGDSTIDLNNDNEIQRSEAEAVTGLIMNYNYFGIGRLVDFAGIENFNNLLYLKITGLGEASGGSINGDELLSYDFSALKKLEYLEFNNVVTNFSNTLNLSGLPNLKHLKLINDRPYYEVFTDENIALPVNFINVDLQGTENLLELEMINSFLKINFCEVPALRKLNMSYLEGGEPEVFDFHCLTQLEWLDISENLIKSLILKNSSVTNTLIANDIGASNMGNYPFVEYICLDDIPEELEQIVSLRDESTVVDSKCSFQ
ncbi:hypothetical protein [Salinimicrobium oceani]|uniref:Leucine-rich repeat domain-containing protein n=1 Tax=Salinimicrobium oceani TaxID=2722702 RepID=A0ABX1D0P6_9FLAO|nr:hypothetical protein [Salinimicrobium oceani]NJW54055.1 hypothetical protein [Salinimicrobium oceani]